ncbi:response regulator [Sphingomonas piscis]|uniref:Response regulator n=1 Tax=Sphingomonas piscis TaxID=2714943 RepID=A0A6G7YPJ7_9SPHN|nr:response regulator [Sphingomonas piscis]QIK78665.1 response regulator [Sphingomonas piscis]
MHALIIEDDWLIADLIQGGLSDLGYTSFDVARNEDEAVSLAEERCPELITADGRLTDGSGVGAVRSICENRQIPVVFITGDQTPIVKIVPDAIIVDKPFRTDDLKEAVGVALTKRITFRRLHGE